MKILVAAFAATVVFCSCVVEPRKPLRPSGRIVVLGDSLALSPTPETAFPAILEDRLTSAGVSWTVYNAGVRGDTTAGGLSRISGLLARNRPDLVIVALGANDGMRHVDVREIGQNLGQIVARVKAGGAVVLLCGMELPPINLFGYGHEFKEVFARVSEDYDVPLVPFLLEHVALEADMNGPDGIHPNARGAQRIAETVWPYLLGLLPSE